MQIDQSGCRGESKNHAYSDGDGEDPIWQTACHIHPRIHKMHDYRAEHQTRIDHHSDDWERGFGCYIRRKIAVMDSLGFPCRVVSAQTEREIELRIDEANDDNCTHGILMQLPLANNRINTRASCLIALINQGRRWVSNNVIISR